MTRLHFIGVGGSGMSAVAHLWSAQGATVTGTDRGEDARTPGVRAYGPG